MPRRINFKLAAFFRNPVIWDDSGVDPREILPLITYTTDMGSVALFLLEKKKYLYTKLLDYKSMLKSLLQV